MTPNRLQSLPLSGLRAIEVILRAGTRSASVRNSRPFARVLSRVKDEKGTWPLSLAEAREALQAIVDDSGAESSDRDRARRALGELDKDDDKDRSKKKDVMLGGVDDLDMAPGTMRERASAMGVGPMSPEAWALFERTMPPPPGPTPEQNAAIADALANAFGFPPRRSR